jgi:hypothetical protein
MNNPSCARKPAPVPEKMRIIKTCQKSKASLEYAANRATIIEVKTLERINPSKKT